MNKMFLDLAINEYHTFLPANCRIYCFKMVTVIVMVSIIVIVKKNEDIGDCQTNIYLCDPTFYFIGDSICTH